MLWLQTGFPRQHTIAGNTASSTTGVQNQLIAILEQKRSGLNKETRFYVSAILRNFRESRWRRDA